MIRAMSNEDEPSVLGALPRSRPHRRSAKRATRPAVTEPDLLDAVAGVPPSPTGDEERPGAGGAGATELLTTAVQAAAELAEIGLTASARALRIALSRLPRP
jgi:hypothetical protein